MKSFLTFLALPFGAALPWILLFAYVAVITSKREMGPGYIFAPDNTGALLFAFFGMAGMFIAGLIVSFFMRGTTVSTGARFGWGVGLSITIIVLVWILQLRSHNAALRANKIHEQNIAALKAKKNPNAPKGSTESFLGEMVMLRPVEGQWMLLNPDLDPKPRAASAMSVTMFRVGGFFPHGVWGWVDDESDTDLHEWWVTITRSKDLNLTKTQRYRAWVTQEKPAGYEKDGTPILSGEKAKTKFWGSADVIADEYYKGYDPKDVEL